MASLLSSGGGIGALKGTARSEEKTTSTAMAPASTMGDCGAAVRSTNAVTRMMPSSTTITPVAKLSRGGARSSGRMGEVSTPRKKLQMNTVMEEANQVITRKPKMSGARKPR